MGVLKIIRNTDDELKYMYHALHYITGEHTDYDKRYSLNTDLRCAYHQFYAIKKYFDKTSGNPVFHFVVVYTPRSAWDIFRAESCSRCIGSYLSERYQVIWGIHEKHTSTQYGGYASLFHAHFVMNSVSYMDGKMFSGNHSEIYALLEHIKKVTGDHSWILKYGSDAE